MGYSDHTQGILASSLAVTFGAKVFEKHFTLDKNMSGPDHWFSEDPDGLKNWVDSIRTATIMLGSEEVKATEREEKTKILARRSIVALSDIKQGESFNQNNIGLRRPGNGLPAVMIEEIFGKKSTKRILKGNLLKTDDFV